MFCVSASIARRRFAAQRSSAQTVAQAPRRLHAIAQVGQIARTAARHRQPPQRARDIGRGAQRLARACAAVRNPWRSFPPRHAARSIAFTSVSGAASRPASMRAPARGHGAIDPRQQRAAALAGQGLRQFQVAPRGGIDAHEMRRRHARDAAAAHTLPFWVSSR